MSQLRVNEIVSENGSGVPNFPNGATGVGVVGVATYAATAGIATYAATAGIATIAQRLQTSQTIQLSGDATGSGAFDGSSGLNITVDVNTATSADSATVATNAQGLTGTPNITVGNIIGAAATFSGDVSIGGTLTYEDVTDVNATGIITANNGISVTAGGVNVDGGGLVVTGVSTFNSGLNLNNILAEEVNVTAGKLSDNTNIDVENGMVHLFTTAESTTSTPNIRYNGSTALNARMIIGQSVVVTLITTANASAYSANITIDGSAVTENWIGGSAPTDGGSSGVDIHSFTIIKTADATFTVIGNHSKTS